MRLTGKGYVHMVHWCQLPLWIEDLNRCLKTAEMAEVPLPNSELCRQAFLEGTPSYPLLLFCRRNSGLPSICPFVFLVYLLTFPEDFCKLSLLLGKHSYQRDRHHYPHLTNKETKPSKAE